MNKKNILKSPGGMRSYLPQVASELRSIENQILDVFALWGCRPVITPTLEYYESLTSGMGKSMEKRLYKFIDYDGNILALRPEMTAPIARTLANRMNDINLPLRLSYSAPVFRYDEPQTGKNREIYQLGVEFIGEKDYLADAEAIILAVESLLKTGVEDFKIDIGHAGYLNGIIKEMELNEETAVNIKGYLNKKDLVGLNEYIVENISQKNNVITKINRLRGDKGVLIQADKLVNNGESKEAVKNLRKVYHYIESYGLADYIGFDLSLIRGFDYYTGIVFEGFTERLGYTICGGGRYDNLLNRYCGREIPAVGFAVGIERVRLALNKQGHQFDHRKIDELIVFNNKNEEIALKTARRLRQMGLITILAENESSSDSEEIAVLSDSDEDDYTGAADGENGINRSIIKRAEKLGLERIISFNDKNDMIVYYLQENKRKQLSPEDIKGAETWEK